MCLGGAFYSLFVKKDIADSDFGNIKKMGDIGEQVAHGKRASGIDTTACLLGGAIRYQLKDGDFNQPSWERVSFNPSFKFDIFSTRVERNTGTSVFNIAHLKLKHPKIVESIMKAIGDITESLLASEDLNSDDSLELFKLNHNLLSSLKLSIPIVDQAALIANRENFVIKITGAGNGGCIIAIYPSYFTESDVLKARILLTEIGLLHIEAQYEAEGF